MCPTSLVIRNGFGCVSPVRICGLGVCSRLGAEYRIDGPATNLRWLGRVLEHPDFVAGDYDTGFVERLPSPESDPLGLPESLFMLTPTFLIFDHLRHKIRVVSHAHLNGDIERAYSEAIGRIDELVDRLGSPLSVRGRGRSSIPKAPSQLSSNMTKAQVSEG